MRRLLILADALRATTKRRTLAVLALAFGFLALAPATPALAGAPHFVDDTVTAVRSGDVLTVSGKEAGLGDEPQVHIVVTATAACVNPGGNEPSAANKHTVIAEGDFLVQNGMALFSLTLVADFQPPCSPPMAVRFGDVVVTDTTSGITLTLPGTF
jgi:hypothetical protein